MTPRQVARTSLRFADVLLSIAAEMRRSDPCDAILAADRAAGFTLAAALREERGRFDFPVGLTLVDTLSLPADVWETAGETWRAFGESLRVEVERAAVPVKHSPFCLICGGVFGCSFCEEPPDAA